MQSRWRVSAPRSIMAIIAAVTLGLSGCGDDDDGGTGGDGSSASDTNALSVEMKDHSYSISGNVSSGLTAFDLSNTGDEYHMIALGRFKAGKGMDDLEAVLEEAAEEGEGDGGGDSNDGDSTSTTEAALASPELELISQEQGGEEEDPLQALFEGELGAPGGFMAPGAAATVTVEDLEDGDYGMLCYLGDEDGTYHYELGMVGGFTVDDDESEGEAPKADQTITLGEKSVSGIPAELDAGEVTFKVDAGGDDHEFGVVELNEEDADFEEVDEYFATAFEEGSEFVTRANLDEQPAILTAYSFDFDGTLYFTIDLEPGIYFIGCAFESEDGSHGGEEMVKVTVT